DLRTALARLEESRAQVQVSRSFLYPSVRLEPSALRQEFSANRPNPAPIVLTSVTVNTFNLPVNVSYELDVWGRVRRSLESASNDFQASAADYESVRLSLTSEVARNYFLLRGLDTEQKILERTLAARKQSLDLVRSRVQAGIVTELDLRQAETELATAESLLLDLQRSRTEYELTLSALCGFSASVFLVAADTLRGLPASLPVSVPSDMLTQRPDVARAEFLMASANAQVGVSVGTLLPRVSLTASGGFQSSDLSKLVSSDSRTWLIGVGVSVPLFEGFRNLSNISAAKSRYEQSLGQYRQTVLNAFKEVETVLMNLKLRASQSAVQARAVTAARQSAALVRERYTKGLVNYLDVVNAERTALDAERQATQILSQRLVYSVLLVKATGGGWNTSQLPTK
ncbi:MAG: efflux transporter outer membrane subunit, partial [Rhizobacter sp.]|nr:efflux transporter outer membrane subunit [Chlorobiales bacterium]